MFTSASCVQLRRQPNAMDREKKNDKTPKNNIGRLQTLPFQSANRKQRQR